MVDYISKTNNNKFSAPRPEGTKINAIVITHTHTYTTLEAVNTLHKNGASVHYTIDREGFQNQYHLESSKAFYAGKSSWHTISGVNDYAIGVMLDHKYEAGDQFTEPQIKKLISLIQDINTRYGYEMEVVGLGEVATVSEQRKHIAPGNYFPWQKLAESGIGRQVNIPDHVSRECKINPKDTTGEVVNLQSQLKDWGYGVEQTGIYDDVTAHLVTVFKGRYIQDETPDHINCWNDAAQYTLNELLHLDNSQFSQQSDEL